MAKFGTYVQEAYDELLHKVTWPSWSSLQQTTAIVLVALALITGIVFGMNAAADAVLNGIYKMI